MATCPGCGAPLIPTLAFRKYEFYCLECGRHYGFLSPRPAEPTPELNARYEALKAEFDEHAGDNLVSDGAWYHGCARCDAHQEPHSAHATDEEWDADAAARVWLLERAGGPE